MWTYLQRWQVCNALYHFRAKRGGVVWIQEHDLIIWIAGMDLRTHSGKDSLFDRGRARLNYFFFGVSNANDFFTKVRNVISSCEHADVHWIRQTRDPNSISPLLNLTTRGEEIYALSHLIGNFFGNAYVKWAFTAAIVWFLAHQFNITIQG